jgi:hypothetical protein
MKIEHFWTVERDPTVAELEALDRAEAARDERDRRAALMDADACEAACFAPFDD